MIATFRMSFRTSFIVVFAYEERPKEDRAGYAQAASYTTSAACEGLVEGGGNGESNHARLGGKDRRNTRPRLACLACCGARGSLQKPQSLPRIRPHRCRDAPIPARNRQWHRLDRRLRTPRRELVVELVNK